MKKRGLLLAAALFCFSAIAYAAPDNKDYTPYHTAARGYNVHAEPSPSSKIVSKIKPGDAVFLMRWMSDAKTGDDQTAWFQITHGPDGKAGAGYIVAERFLKENSLTHGGIRFTFARTPDEKRGLAEISLAAYDANGRLLASAKPVTTVAAFPVLFTPQTGNGLSGVQCIIRLYVSYDACGEPACTYYYAWTGTNLVLLTSSFTMGGAVTGYDETLFFPDNGAPSGTILKVIEATEYEEESEDEAETENGPRVKSKRYASQIYLWDGNRAVLQTPEPELFNWFQDYLKR